MRQPQGIAHAGEAELPPQELASFHTGAEWSPTSRPHLAEYGHWLASGQGNCVDQPQ